MNTSNLDDINNVVDSYTNTFDLEKVENGKEKHPLEDLNSLKMQNDIYDLPPGYVSRQRFGMDWNVIVVCIIQIQWNQISFFSGKW